MRRLALFAAAALIGVASCGDDSTSSATTTNTEVGSAAAEPSENTVVDATVVDATVVDETFPADTADPDAPGVGSEFCDISNELNANAFDPFEATPDEVEVFFTVSFPEMFSRLTTAAPAELDDDIATVGAAYGLLTTDLQNNGWDMSASFANTKVQEAMTGEELSAAGANLDAYCGL